MKLVLGRVDKVHGRSIFGWALDDKRAAEHLMVGVLANDILVAQGTADKTRADPKSAGFGEGDHAFEIQAQSELKLGDLRMRMCSGGTITQLEVADAEKHKLSELYDILVGRYDALFGRMAHWLQGYERLLNETIRMFEATSRYIDPRLADFNSRLETGRISLPRLDQLVRRLVERNVRRKRKRLIGLFWCGTGK